MLRHGCGNALANAGHDTRALQAWLGHKNIQHTVRYTELAAIIVGRCDMYRGPDGSLSLRQGLRRSFKVQRYQCHASSLEIYESGTTSSVLRSRQQRLRVGIDEAAVQSVGRAAATAETSHRLHELRG